MKLRYFLPILASAALLFSSCDDVINPAIENFKDIDEMNKEPEFAKGFLQTAYRTLPGYYDNSDVATDDAVTNGKSDSYMKVATGAWTASFNPFNRWTADYSAIQYLNTFLDKMDGIRFVKTSAAVDSLLKIRMKGEAYGLRAIHHYFLLRAHAGFTDDGQLLGIPIHNHSIGSSDNFNEERPSFQTCVDSIEADLNRAEKLLPQEYGNISSASQVPEKYRAITTDPDLYNRAMGNVARQLINGLIIESFRSRLFLFAASPAFQDSSNKTTWAEAADAAAEVVDYAMGPEGLSATGETYYTNDDEIATLKEGSNPEEIIWRENLSTNTTSDEDNNYPPSLFGKGYINPTQNLVDAFPMANGYPITDARSGYDVKSPYAGRDPRLAKYIIYNGAKEGPNNKTIYTGSKLGTDDGIDVKETSTRTGYYMKKRLNMKVNCDPTSKTGVNRYTPRIRYTEIYLNYAEAANEAWGPKARGTHNYSAYDIIKAIRHRAGITDDSYLDECAESKDKMRELIHNERRLELCFESFRFWDLRRWKANLDETATGIDWGTESYTALPSVEKRDYQDYMYYGPIPFSETLKYSNLKQNKGWK
jgi:hypothetical protein